MKDLCYINTWCDSEDGSVRPWRFPQQVKSTGTFSEFLTEINHFSSKKKLKLGWVKLLFYPGKIKIKKECKLLFWVKMLIWEIIFFFKEPAYSTHTQTGGRCGGRGLFWAEQPQNDSVLFFLVILWFYDSTALRSSIIIPMAWSLPLTYLMSESMSWSPWCFHVKEDS